MKLLKPSQSHWIFAILCLGLAGCNNGTNLDGTCTEALVDDYNRVVLERMTAVIVQDVEELENLKLSARAVKRRYPHTVCEARVYDRDLRDYRVEDIDVVYEMDEIIDEANVLLADLAAETR